MVVGMGRQSDGAGPNAVDPAGQLDGATAGTPSPPAGPEVDMVCRVFHGGHHAATVVPWAELREALAEPQTFVWVDGVDPSPAELSRLAQAFHLHPLAVEDIVHAHQRPKIEPYGDGDDGYWFLVVHPATLVHDELQLHEMAIFTGRRFLITIRQLPVYPLEDIERRWRSLPERLHGESGLLLYTVLDAVVDSYFPVADHFEERVDAVEALLFSPRPRQDEVLRAIFSMKKDGQRFRRAAVPMREILAPIMRGDLPLFSESQAAYFRDVYDHAVRVIDQADTTRDLTNSALDVQLSATANRQSEISKQLTLIATVFLPLSFITGFFGQNFSLLTSHITSPTAFWVFGVASQVTVVALLVVFFKRRGWL